MKRYWFGIIAIVFMFFLGGCVGDTTIETTLPSLDDLEIVMQDEFEVPAGSYSYPFSIADFESFQAAYGLTLSVDVQVLEDDFSFTLENGVLSFDVLPDHVYVVTIQVLGEGVDISETRTVYATKTALQITFDNQIDGFTNEVVTCWKNDSIEAPLTQPTQDGYEFITWAYDLEGEQPWNAADTFTENTTVYAIWQEILDNVLVTYDLNGAFQPEPIEVQVQEGSILLPPQFTPVWTGYAFDGWYYDSEGTNAVSFGNDTITSNVTIYAKWHYVYLENYENDLFSGPLFEDHSTMLDHMPIQIYQAQAIVLTTHIDWDLVQEIGVVYSTDATVSLLDPTDFHVVGDLGNVLENSMVSFAIDTQVLRDATDYYGALYVKTDTTIYYSDIASFRSATVVQNGYSFGCDGIKSGGSYYIDNGSLAHRPSLFWIEISDGFQATLNGVGFASYQNIYSSGIHRLIVTENLTGEKYLHVFETQIQNPPMALFLESLNLNSENGLAQIKTLYQIQTIETGTYHYDIHEAGILYSFDTFIIDKGISGVSMAAASIEDGWIENSNWIEIPSNVNIVYVRGYLNADGKYYYSDTITVLERTSETTFSIAGIIGWSEVIANSQWGTSFNPGPSVVSDVAVFTPSQQITSFTGEFELLAEGTYYVWNHNVPTHVTKVIIGRFVPAFDFVTEGAIYTSPIQINFGVFGSWLEISTDGMNYDDIADGIWISEPGDYELVISVPYDTVIVHFSIVDPSDIE